MTIPGTGHGGALSFRPLGPLVLARGADGSQDLSALLPSELVGRKHSIASPFFERSDAAYHHTV